MLGTGIATQTSLKYDIIIDGSQATLSAKVDTDEISSRRNIYRNPAEALRADRNVIPSISLIRDAKIKPFIDGVYAAVESYFASEGGVSRPDFLRTLEKFTSPAAKTYVSAALASSEGVIDELIGTNNQQFISKYTSDPQIKTPQSYFLWTEPLKKSWSAMKGIQMPPSAFIQGSNIDSKIMNEIGEILGKNPELNDTFQTMRKIYAKMTNSPENVLSLFPPASLPDQHYFVKKSIETQSDLDEGLGKIFIKAVKNGEISFTPDEKSGLYVYQMHELEALIKRDSPEFRKYLVEDEYAQVLDNVAISGWVATRHTHAPQIDYSMGLIGASFSSSPPAIYISPDLPVEPIVTVYDRMIDSLKFMEKALVDNLPGFIEETGRIYQDGTQSIKTIKSELSELVDLVRGFSILSKESIHMPYNVSGNEEQLVANTLEWIRNASSDPDLDRDFPIFVPIIKTTDGSSYKCYTLAGFELMPLDVEYEKNPEVRFADEKPETKDLEDDLLTRLMNPRFNRPQIEMCGSSYNIPVAVHNEVIVPKTRLINDTMWRDLLPKNHFTHQKLNEVLADL